MPEEIHGHWIPASPVSAPNLPVADHGWSYGTSKKTLASADTVHPLPWPHVCLFPPALWNVFDRTTDNRTNNYVEGIDDYGRRLSVSFRAEYGDKSIAFLRAWVAGKKDC